LPVAIELLFAAHALETDPRDTAPCDVDAILWLAEERDVIRL
jgi:hypothetical protein